MKILILTQNETLYLPASFAAVCVAYPEKVVCIVSAPTMSTHGGAIKGFFRHLNLFGIKGTAIMAYRIIKTEILNLTNKPKKNGQFYSIKAVADTFGIPFREIGKVKTDLSPIIDEFSPDLLISISCPQIISKAVRERFSKGCINVHGAPLPRYRGLMPAFWALKNNEKFTAVTVHDIGDKLDNGEILAQKQVEITPDDTWDSLVRKTKSAGASLLIEVIGQIAKGEENRKANPDSKATYFSFPKSNDRLAFIKAGRRFF